MWKFPPFSQTQLKQNQEEIPPETETENSKKTQIAFWNPFQLPITYVPEQDLHPLSNTVASDLELLPVSQSSIYDHLLLNESSSVFAKQMTSQWAQQFTTNTDFLFETQQIIQNLPQPPQEPQELQKIQQTWEEITLTDDFKEKFNYLEFRYLEPFNHNSIFLECLNIVHLSTPIFSFIMFIFFILLPIFIMVNSKTPFNIDTYIQHMASLAKVSFMGKMAKSAVFNGWYHYQTLGMVIGCFLFYGVQFYNSYVSYFRFWRNVELVNRHLLTVRDFVRGIIPNVKTFLETCQSSPTYHPFCRKTKPHLEQLEIMQEHWLSNIQPYSYSISKCYDFGTMFQSYYELHTNCDFDIAIRYATGFQGFWENIHCLKSRLSDQSISMAIFSALPECEADLEAEPEADPDAETEAVIETKPVEEIEVESDAKSETKTMEELETKPDAEIEENFETEPDAKSYTKPEANPPKKAPKKDNQLYGMYYPAHQKEEAVRNDCILSENWVITGPNASGKTTYLKTVALNMIFTQQFGMGFYRQCVLLRPYTQFHTYLNIPDTSDRDSLFQAEVRRGKEILDAATLSAETSPTTNKTNIFLLMDELFSGTNHDDAVQAAFGFLCYLGHQERKASTRFLLTTHFVEICDKIQSTAPHVAINGKMIIEETAGTEEEGTEEEGGGIRYLYQFKEGISRLRCGIHILKQMNYPKEVMHYF